MAAVEVALAAAGLADTEPGPEALEGAADLGEEAVPEDIPAAAAGAAAWGAAV